LEHGADLSFAKTELAERGEDLGLHLHDLVLDGMAVGRAIGVAHAHAFVAERVEEEFAAVVGPVVGSAQSNEVVGRLRPPSERSRM
jgi:hypothetical protein